MAENGKSRQMIVSRGMYRLYTGLYARLVLRHPKILLACLALLLAVGGVRIPHTYIEASADALVLEGDADLEYFRDLNRRYPSSDFLLVSFSPLDGDLLQPQNLEQLRVLVDDLQGVEGVSAVNSLLDVPLLYGLRGSVSQLAQGGLPTVRDGNFDRAEVRDELLNSPLYSGMMTDAEMRVAAVQVILETDPTADLLLREREALRDRLLAEGLSATEEKRLHETDAAYSAENQRMLRTRESQVAEVRQILERHRDGATLFLGGVSMIAVDMVDFIRSDLRVFGVAIFIFIVLALALIFRQLRWVILPLFSCACVATGVLGLLAWLGWNMTVVSANFLVLLMVVSLSLAMHLTVRYRELHALYPARSQSDLVSDTVRFMARPCLFMVLTTMLSFLSMLFSRMRPLIDFGWMMSVGVAVALLLIFLILPALLMVLGKSRTPVEAADPAHTFTRHFAKAEEHWGTKILVVSALLFVCGIWGMTRLQVETRFIDYFSPDTDIYQGMEVIDRSLGGTTPLEVVLGAPLSEFEPPPSVEEDPFADFAFPEDDAGEDSAQSVADPWLNPDGLRRIEQVHDYLDSLPETGKVLSLAVFWKMVRELLGHTPDALELSLFRRALPEQAQTLLIDPWVFAEQREARIGIRVKETSRELRRADLLHQIRTDLVQRFGFRDQDVRLSGLLVLYNNLLQSLYQSLFFTLALVMACIFIMFLFLFRSFSLAVLALLPNLLAVSVVMGAMGLFGQPLDLMTVTIAAVVLGMGVDNTIHYIWRFAREFPADHDYTAAIRRTHGSVGRAMYYTSVTVIVGFSIFMLSNFRPSIVFGLLTALAMFLALLGALLLLPQLLRRTYHPEIRN